MSRLFNCFSHPTPSASTSTSRSPDTLPPPPPPPYTETPSHSQSFHSAPSLSTQHRKNGYENLTLHFTQSENANRERRLRGFHHRVVERGERGDERGGMAGERRDVAAQDVKVTKEREEKRVKNVFKEEFEDDISELRLDGDAEGGGAGGEQEARVVTATRIQSVGEATAEIKVQGEGARQGERAQMGRGKGRDYCTPEVRRRVEEWIAGCEMAECKGFVKRVREATGGSGENSNGGRSSGNGDGNETKIESAVRVRGGGLAPGWPEWGRGWGAYSKIQVKSTIINMDNSPVTPKKTLRPCPRCPHRLSDLWTHESPPESLSVTQPLPAVPEKEESSNNEDDGGDSSSEHTSCLPPDYSDTSSEKSQPPGNITEEQHQADIARYYELRSDDDDLHGSSDEEDDEDWKSAREYHSDEEHLLNKDAEGALEDKNYPAHYTCPYDNIYHGVPVQGETTYPIGEIGEDMIVKGGVMEYTAEEGTVFLWKLCDNCLYSNSEGPDADTEHQSGSLGQFEG